MGRTINRTDHPKLDAWLSAIEGTQTPQSTDGRDVVCDYCEATIEPNTPVTNYIANKLLNKEFLPVEGDHFHFLRVYCSDCDRQELKYPCRGYTEILLAGYIDEQKRLQDLSIADVSVSSDGIPYDPKEVWQVTHPGATWEEYNRAAAMHSRTGLAVAMGPGDLIDNLLYHGIDPEDVFTSEGDIITDEEEIREQMRHQHEE